MKQSIRTDHLNRLPIDILLIVLGYFNAVTISNLSRTCRHLYAVIEELGWKLYAIENSLPSQSLTPALDYSWWSMKDLIRHQKLAQRAWELRDFVCHPLGPEWSSKFHPVMAISTSRLVVAAGNALFCYKFAPPTRRHHDSTRVIFERIITFPKDARKDISGVAFEPDGQGLVLSFVHGTLGRIRLPQPSTYPRRQGVSFRGPALSHTHEQGHAIRSMSAVNNTVLTINSAGIACLYSLSDSTTTLISTVNVGQSAPATGWSTHLSLHSSAGYAVLGTSSATPLVVHAITESGLDPHPYTILSPSGESPMTSTTSAVYSITGATRTFPWNFASDQVVLAGWYQGIISIHDLRCPTHHDSSQRGQTLNPALTLDDPLTMSPIYSLSSAGAHVAAGSAQHSLVHLYDVRSPKKGWSIYLPQGRSASSPVYSCMIESTRLWAATESRAFAVDFGQVHESTFPFLKGRIAAPGSRDNISWHAPFYEHTMFSNTYI